MIITSQPKNGYDSWVDSANTHTEHGSGSIIQLQWGLKNGFLWLPLSPRIKGTTITSAILTGHAHGATAAMTVTVERASAKWEAGKVNWANQPAVTGAAATASIGALTDGQEFSVDITTPVQAVANGASHFGWRIRSSVAGSVQKFASFNSGSPAWTLTVEFGEVPDPPNGLAPDGTVVGSTKPIVTWDAHDYGGDETDVAAARILVDVNADGSVDWDSGWVSQTVTQMDLSTFVGSTITSGTSVKWRVAVQDADGGQSAYSDWAIYTYRPLPSLTLDSPAAGVLFDPTSDILAHISGGGPLGWYSAEVTDGTDRSSVRLKSGRRKATDPSNIAYAMPLKNADGSRVFTDDEDFQIFVRASDTYDRQSTPDCKAWVEVSTTVHFDDDASPTVASFQATQVDQTPFVQLTWTDLAAADAYLISRDNVHIARLTAADTIAGVSTYTWVDHEAAPVVRHVYSIRRITNGVGRSAPKRDAITTAPTGFWLMRDNGHYVRLTYTTGDTGVTFVTAERRANYTPIGLPYTVDILTGYEGISGHAGLSVCDMDDQPIEDALAVLDAIKSNPGETVRALYNNVSKPVRVKNMTVLPHLLFNAATQLHAVDFDVVQVGDFDWRV